MLLSVESPLREPLHFYAPWAALCHRDGLVLQSLRRRGTCGNGLYEGRHRNCVGFIVRRCELLLDSARRSRPRGFWLS
ncbi:hypothetical protein Fuma_03046 [Fuerstiella marisgermanici]|uniref:Uncharacterized protein n=1 Tax=Fuerstiella marisgermanici TaxID=1891926 RepID=A0A1P8WH86_9PLAN|nr:hypothetical protein Fuma_03046 [Fuerstiella marisgermanici]